MTFEQQIEAEHQRILKERDKVIKTMAVRLWEDLKEVSPVGENRPSRPWKNNPNRMTEPYLGGELRNSWEAPKQIIGGWRISNFAPHANVIDGGRRTEGGKTYGSEQLPDGFTPTVIRAETDMNKALGAIK